MKRIYSAIILVSLSTFLLFTSVPTASAAGAGPYVGIFGGYVMPDNLKVENGDSIEISLDNSWTLGAKVGYIFPQAKWFAAELEYFYLAKQDVDEIGAEGDFSANNVMVNFLCRYPEGKIHPFAGFGLGWSWAEFNGSSSELGSLDESDNAFAWQILAGVNFEIVPNLSAEIAYRYFSSKYSEVSGFDVTTRNHMALVGLNYHF